MFPIGPNVPRSLTAVTAAFRDSVLVVIKSLIKYMIYLQLVLPLASDIFGLPSGAAPGSSSAMNVEHVELQITSNWCTNLQLPHT